MSYRSGQKSKNDHKASLKFDSLKIKDEIESHIEIIACDRYLIVYVCYSKKSV